MIFAIPLLVLCVSGEAPHVAKYEEAISKLTKWSENLTNDDFWKDAKIKKKSGDVIKFGDLSQIEKRVFYIVSAEKLTAELRRIEGIWQEGLADAKEDDEGEDRPPTKKELGRFIARLRKVREATAVRFEGMAERLFADDTFSKEEGRRYMGKIRAMHDKDKLIERK